MPFPFLQLATETRLQIYRLLLPYSKYNVEEEKIDSPVRWYLGEYDCPGILFVNYQIHREAAEILYHENFFALYIKHAHAPRLPMNESRADSESFMFVSWAKSPKMVKTRTNRTWAHPQNPRIPLSLLGSHQHFHHIRKFHVSLPPFDGLAGVDMFMKKTSFAAFHGVQNWVENRAGNLDVAEQDRMSIVQQFKDPIDELGKLLQILERIEQLCISVQASKFQITFSEYLVEELLKVSPVGRATCFFAPSMTTVWDTVDCFQLKRWEDLLRLPPRKSMKKSQLPLETDDMYRLLQAIRTYQQLEFGQMPDWLSRMPA